LKRRILQWKQIFKEKSRKRYRRRFLLYISCVFLALVFWFLNILNKSHRFELNTILQFTNIPGDKALSIKENRTVSFTVEGSGWNLLRSKLLSFSDTLTIDYRSIRGKDEIDLNKLLLDFESQWSQKMRIMNVYPTKLDIIVEKKRIKKVPIEAILNLGFADGYDLSSKVNWYPDSIYITGPLEYINSIKSIKTIPLILQNLNASKSIELPIDFNKYPNINSSIKSIKLNIPVEHYTEGLMDIAISQRNESAGILTFPSKCKVSYKVALSNFHKVIPQSFKIIAEYDRNLSNRLKLKLISKPNSVKDIQLTPETVEYIILKR